MQQARQGVDHGFLVMDDICRDGAEPAEPVALSVPPVDDVGRKSVDQGDVREGRIAPRAAEVGFEAGVHGDDRHLAARAEQGRVIPDTRDNTLSAGQTGAGGKDDDFDERPVPDHPAHDRVRRLMEAGRERDWPKLLDLGERRVERPGDEVWEIGWRRLVHFPNGQPEPGRCHDFWGGAKPALTTFFPDASYR